MRGTLIWACILTALVSGSAWGAQAQHRVAQHGAARHHTSLSAAHKTTKAHAKVKAKAKKHHTRKHAKAGAHSAKPAASAHARTVL